MKSFVEKHLPNSINTDLQGAVLALDVEGFCASVYMMCPCAHVYTRVRVCVCAHVRTSFSIDVSRHEYKSTYSP